MGVILSPLQKRQSMARASTAKRKYTKCVFAIYIILVLYMPRDTSAQNNANQIKIKRNKIELVARGKKQEITIKFQKTKLTIKLKNMPIVPILSTLTSPITAGINAVTQNQVNKQNRKLTIDMFNMTNAYNTPLNQVKRMKEAGINPALMNGNVQTVNSAQQPKAPEVRPYQIPENLMADVAQKLASARLADSTADLNRSYMPPKLQSETNRNNASIPLIEQQTETAKQMALKVATEAQKIQQQYNLDQRLFETNVQYRREQLKQLQTDVLKAKQELSTLPAETQAKIELLKNQAIESSKRSKQLDNSDWIFQNQKYLRELNINPEGGLIDTVIKYIVGSAIGAKKWLDTIE